MFSANVTSDHAERATVIASASAMLACLGSSHDGLARAMSMVLGGCLGLYTKGFTNNGLFP